MHEINAKQLLSRHLYDKDESIVRFHIIRQLKKSIFDTFLKKFDIEINEEKVSRDSIELSAKVIVFTESEFDELLDVIYDIEHLKPSRKTVLKKLIEKVNPSLYEEYKIKQQSYDWIEEDEDDYYGYA